MLWTHGSQNIWRCTGEEKNRVLVAIGADIERVVPRENTYEPSRNVEDSLNITVMHMGKILRLICDTSANSQSAMVVDSSARD